MPFNGSEAWNGPPKRNGQKADWRVATSRGFRRFGPQGYAAGLESDRDSPGEKTSVSQEPGKGGFEGRTGSVSEIFSVCGKKKKEEKQVTTQQHDTLNWPQGKPVEKRDRMLKGKKLCRSQKVRRRRNRQRPHVEGRFLGSPHRNPRLVGDSRKKWSSCGKKTKREFWVGNRQEK